MISQRTQPQTFTIEYQVPVVGVTVPHGSDIPVAPLDGFMVYMLLPGHHLATLEDIDPNTWEFRHPEHFIKDAFVSTTLLDEEDTRDLDVFDQKQEVIELRGSAVAPNDMYGDMVRPWCRDNHYEHVWRPAEHLLEAGEAFLQIDLRRLCQVTHISTKGRYPKTHKWPQMRNYHGTKFTVCNQRQQFEWVTSYSVEGRLPSGRKWFPIGTFVGNSDAHSEKLHLLPCHETGKGVTCQHLRFRPLKWHNAASMRVGVFGWVAGAGKGKYCPSDTSRSFVENSDGIRTTEKIEVHMRATEGAAMLGRSRNKHFVGHNVFGGDIPFGRKKNKDKRDVKQTIREEVSRFRR